MVFHPISKFSWFLQKIPQFRKKLEVLYEIEIKSFDAHSTATLPLLPVLGNCKFFNQKTIVFFPQFLNLHKFWELLPLQSLSTSNSLYFDDWNFSRLEQRTLSLTSNDIHWQKRGRIVQIQLFELMIFSHITSKGGKIE